MTNKLENVNLTLETFKDAEEQVVVIKGHEGEKTITEALTIYQAILEKRVLLVPVEASEGMLDKLYYGVGDNPIAHDAYKAMTQAVDTDELLKEILG